MTQTLIYGSISNCWYWYKQCRLLSMHFLIGSREKIPTLIQKYWIKYWRISKMLKDSMILELLREMDIWCHTYDKLSCTLLGIAHVHVSAVTKLTLPVFIVIHGNYRNEESVCKKPKSVYEGTEIWSENLLRRALFCQRYSFRIAVWLRFRVRIKVWYTYWWRNKVWNPLRVGEFTVEHSLSEHVSYSHDSKI